MGKNKFFIGVLIGAVAGGAISLIDRQTRKEMKNLSNHMIQLAKEPKALASSTTEIVEKAKLTMQQVNEDMQFICEKVEDLQQLSPQVKELVEETKTVFLPEQQVKVEQDENK
ncbi:gas vesicle protein [Oikeobacillus pervagus]|uniref:Gas vesicle protein n=1 Tax=Oikeobacillus pervagus TaxID=1325931 RepID=A0AAJ1T949_9BACI|nr:YtxH domain-containing protein [Oikeobacillus pervagus]MDQ0216890.1 gas vesicle protein [Oikeobacillus pervagus]